MKKFSISYLKSMQLYFTHQLVPKSDEPRPWGGPWECTNVKNNNLKAGKMGFWWPHEAFLPWISVPRHTSIHKNKQHVAVVGLVLSRQLLEWKKRHSWNLRANKVQRSELATFFALVFSVVSPDGRNRHSTGKRKECRGSPARKRRNVEGHPPENARNVEGHPLEKARNVEGHPPENAEM